MNKHFEDTRYYLGRAVTTTKAGFGEELGPVRTRVASLRGAEAEPERSRLDRVRRSFRDLGERARTEFDGLRRRRPTR